MEERRIPEYTVDVFADRTNVKAVIKGILNLIFFHRVFIPVQPGTQDILDMTLPYVIDSDLETLVDQRATSYVDSLSSNAPLQQGYNQRTEGGRGQIVVQFMEKKRRKGWFGGKADEELVWESWVLDITIATPRTENEVLKVRRAMESSLQNAATKVITIVNRDKNHIPPITTNETNPFPYTVLVNPKHDGWGQRMGIF